jgi:hypothetical protein
VTLSSPQPSFGWRMGLSESSSLLKESCIRRIYLM